jgi:hypothetical protein
MPSATVWMKVDGAEKYRALSRRLRQAGQGELQRKLTRAIRKEGGPALAAVRQAWLGVEVSSSKGGTAPPDTATGLRRRVAAATRIQVQQRGIRISVNSARIDPPSLVFYLNGFPAKRDWRHPVFGNREVWVAQRGQEVFAPTLRRFAPQWRKAIMQAMEETAREIEG